MATQVKRTKPIKIHDDKLCTVWRKPNGDCFAKGKRLSAQDKIACPLSLSERKRYVAELARSGIFLKWLITESRRDTVTLTEAWNMLKAARAPAYHLSYDSQGNLVGNRKLF